ncbi:MAG: hypothetical protein U9R32_01925 [Bacteroidota bacterium]|nr:hypothetical protein [Bacteroidota bacterium]
MLKFLKKDSFTIGAVIGLFLPALFFLLLSGLNNAFSKNLFEKESYILLLAIAINLLPLRIFLVNLKADKSGRGILAVTFLYVVIYFATF